MADTLRGAAAIVGIGELKPERTRPGRDAMSLLAEAAYLAIQDAGLTKRDIDGMIFDEGMGPSGSGYCAKMAEHMGIFPTWATGCDTGSFLVVIWLARLGSDATALCTEAL